LENVTEKNLIEVNDLTQLKKLSFSATHVLEFDISSILRFKNLKDIWLINFYIKQIQLVPFAEFSDLSLKDLQIDAKSLDLIFIQSRFITQLYLRNIRTSGNLNFNTSFQNLKQVLFCGDYSLTSSNFKRLFKAIEGSANTLTELGVMFPNSEDIESYVDTLKRLTHLNYVNCDILREVILCLN
jgi:hypothetical protein